MVRWSLVWVIITLLAVGTEAQSSLNPTEPAGYREVIAEALAEFEAKHFEEARALFAKANTALETARTLRGLGYAEFELRAYRDAVLHLEQALASEVKPLSGTLRSETERILERANTFVGRYQVRLSPANASLFIDGSEVTLGATLLLDMGEHLLEARATGYASVQRRLQVAGGENQSVELQLTPITASHNSRGAPSHGADRPERRPVYKNPWLWTAVGVVVAGAAVGLALGLRGRDETNQDPYGGNTGVVFQSP